MSLVDASTEMATYYLLLIFFPIGLFYLGGNLGSPGGATFLAFARRSFLD